MKGMNDMQIGYLVSPLQQVNAEHINVVLYATHVGMKEVADHSVDS